MEPLPGAERLAVLLALLCLLLPRASCQGSELPGGGGPALPGSVNYWVRLKTLGVSEGELRQKDGEEFVPGSEDLEVTVENPDTTDLILTPELDLSKYNLLYTPKITLDGEEIKYSPLNAIEISIPLNENIGPLDQTFHLKIADPQGGWESEEKTYNIRVLQPPDFERVVSAQNITVTAGGKAYDSDPPFNTHNSNFLFALQDDVKQVEINLHCPAVDKKVMINGEEYDVGYKHKLDIEGATATIIAQCKYWDAKWTNGSEIQRTYVLGFSRNAALHGTHLDLRMLAGQGSHGNLCEKNNPLDWHAGFTCVTDHELASLIVRYNNSRAEVFLVNNATGIEYRLKYGMPVEVAVPKGAGRTNYQLVMRAGLHSRSAPVTIENGNVDAFQPGAQPPTAFNVKSMDVQAIITEVLPADSVTLHCSWPEHQDNPILRVLEEKGVFDVKSELSVRTAQGVDLMDVAEPTGNTSGPKWGSLKQIHSLAKSKLGHLLAFQFPLVAVWRPQTPTPKPDESPPCKCHKWLSDTDLMCECTANTVNVAISYKLPPNISDILTPGFLEAGPRVSLRLGAMHVPEMGVAHRRVVVHSADHRNNPLPNEEDVHVDLWLAKETLPRAHVRRLDSAEARAAPSSARCLGVALAGLSAALMLRSASGRAGHSMASSATCADDL